MASNSTTSLLLGRDEVDITGTQETGLPAPFRTSYLDATPSGEVQVRVTKERTRTSQSDLRNILDGTRLKFSDCDKDERVGRTAFQSRNRNESAYLDSAHFLAEDKRSTHGRGDTGIYTSPSFTTGLDPTDIREIGHLNKGISCGSPLPTRRTRTQEESISMPSGGMRAFPWKVRTDTEAPDLCDGRTRESTRRVSGFEDNVLGHCDDQLTERRRSPVVGNTWSENQQPTRMHNRFVANNNTSNKNKKAADYDGASSWQDYQVHFEMIAEINGWDNATKALELATSLRGSAQAILSDLRPDQRRSYDHLVAALVSRFQPSNQSELYRVQMKNKTRDKGKILPELAQDIKRLTRLAYPTAPIEVREQLARDCFMDSLGDPDLEWAIFQGKPINIDDSVRIGLEYEAFTIGQRKKFPSRVALRRQTEVTDESDYSDEMGNLVERLARIEQQATRPKPPLTCYFCGIAGHIKRECRKYLASQGRQQGRPGVTRGNTRTYTQGTQTNSGDGSNSGNC